MKYGCFIICWKFFLVLVILVLVGCLYFFVLWVEL